MAAQSREFSSAFRRSRRTRISSQLEHRRRGLASTFCSPRSFGDAGESTPERGGRAKRYFRITAKAVREVPENTAGIEKLDGRALVLGAPRGGDRPVIAVGRPLCRAHRRPETAHECTRGARQLPELAEGGA